jgi:hypothetical protein
LFKELCLAPGIPRILFFLKDYEGGSNQEGTVDKKGFLLAKEKQVLGTHFHRP